MLEKTEKGLRVAVNDGAEFKVSQGKIITSGAKRVEIGYGDFLMVIEGDDVSHLIGVPNHTRKDSKITVNGEVVSEGKPYNLAESFPKALIEALPMISINKTGRGRVVGD